MFFQSLLLAARTEHDLRFHNRTYRLQPGQFVTTLRELAKQCGKDCTVKIVRRTLDKLVACKTWAHGRADGRADAPTLVTWMNWSLYQLPYGDRADDGAHGRAALGHTESTQTQSVTDGKNSNTVVTSFDTQTILEDTPITPKKGKRKKAELTSEESEVLAYLNLKAENSFTAPGEIGKRIAEGHTVEECKTIIDKKVAEWEGTEFAKNLNPTTLFRLCHFDTYLHQKSEKPAKAFDLNTIGKSNMGEEWG